MGELWGVSYEYVEENKPCYDGIAPICQMVWDIKIKIYW